MTVLGARMVKQSRREADGLRCLERWVNHDKSVTQKPGDPF